MDPYQLSCVIAPVERLDGLHQDCNYWLAESIVWHLYPGRQIIYAIADVEHLCIL